MSKPANAKTEHPIEGVRQQLAALGSQSIPADIAVRLHTALASAQAERENAGQQLTVPSSQVPQLRPRRWWAAIAVAAGLVTVLLGGLGVWKLTNGQESHFAQRDTSSGDSQESNVAKDPDLPVPNDAKSQQDQSESGSSLSRENIVPPSSYKTTVAATGTNYTTARFSEQIRSVFYQTRHVPQSRLQDAAPQLTRLTVPRERTRCLAQVTEETALRPTVMDYAFYRGEPALVLITDQGPRVEASKLAVIVVGPKCGIRDADLKWVGRVPR